MVDYLRDRVFPPTDNSVFETTMKKCWFGEYKPIQDLAVTVTEAVQSLNLADYCTTWAISIDELEAIQEECERLMMNDILDLVKTKFASLQENLMKMLSCRVLRKDQRRL